MYIPSGDRFCIGATAGKTALATLSLRQQLVDLLDNGITLNLKFFRGESQQRAE